MEVELLTVTPNYMYLLKQAMGQCYQKQVGDKAVDHLIKSGHLSVLEHCYASFKVTCSISVLLQLTRHRHFSFCVQSSRGSELTTVHKTGIEYLDELIAQVMEDYKYCYQECEKKEDAAYILPKAAEYTFVVTGNFRSWFEYLPKRLCKRAQKEHRDVAISIAALLKNTVPEVFDRDFINCDVCKERSCSFD